MQGNQLDLGDLAVDCRALVGEGQGYWGLLMAQYWGTAGCLPLGKVVEV